MNSIIFICPYFGKLPKDQMKVWLLSCKYNTTVNWLIITDDKEEYDYPPNVKVKYMGFVELSDMIQSRFDFNISLNSPYKLCDFKPAYGYVFGEEIKGYDFWGHCDLSDTIFGNIRMFLTEDILDSYEKILFLGHMTLYKNKDDINKRIFLKTIDTHSLSDILGNKENMAFDELAPYSINQVYFENHFSFYRYDGMYRDISPLRYAFQLSRYDEKYIHHYEKPIPRIFEWNRGHLYDIYLNGKKIIREEIGYMHFQKRKMQSTGGNFDRFLIVPNQFISFDGDIDYEIIKQYSKNKVFYDPFFKLKAKNALYKIMHFCGKRRV